MNQLIFSNTEHAHSKHGPQRRHAFRYRPIWSLIVVLTGCGSTPPNDSEHPVGTSSETIIAGFPASSSKLDMIGTLSVSLPGESTPEFFCSGALIGPHTVVTAKHCIDIVEEAYFAGYTPVFTLGYDSTKPKRVVEIIDQARAPGNDWGGFVGWGHDVGIVQLAESISAVKTLKSGQISEADVGERYIAIGYGVQDNSWLAGTRRTGNVNLRATHGRIYEIIFGSFEAFEDWATNLTLPGPNAPTAAGNPLPREIEGFDFLPQRRRSRIAAAQAGAGGTAGEELPSDEVAGSPGYWLRDAYENTLLAEGYEVFVGGSPGDAQPCHGDSGGPLLRVGSDGTFEVYGVASGALWSSDLICNFGAVYATFGPDVSEFLDEAVKWVDPCGGLSTRGVCAGDVARRCTNALEGKRRLVEFDCSSLGESCAIQSNGEVGCGSDTPLADVDYHTTE